MSMNHEQQSLVELSRKSHVVSPPGRKPNVPDLQLGTLQRIAMALERREAREDLATKLFRSNDKLRRELARACEEIAHLKSVCESNLAYFDRLRKSANVFKKP